MKQFKFWQITLIGLLTLGWSQRLDILPGMESASSANKSNQVETYNLQDSTDADFGNNLSTSAFLFGEMDMKRIGIHGQAVDSLLTFASERLGTRYRSGGEGPGGFDCSGFVNYVFSNFGVSLPRSSGSIAMVGLPISSENAKKGDLIFFSGRGRGKHIGHVGIITNVRDGVIHFIHSASSKGVSYASTSEPYYHARVLGIRRIIKS